jgi:hypothetical protein
VKCGKDLKMLWVVVLSRKFSFEILGYVPNYTVFYFRNLLVYNVTVSLYIVASVLSFGEQITWLLGVA